FLSRTGYLTGSRYPTPGCTDHSIIAAGSRGAFLPSVPPGAGGVLPDFQSVPLLQVGVPVLRISQGSLIVTRERRLISIFSALHGILMDAIAWIFECFKVSIFSKVGKTFKNVVEGGGGKTFFLDILYLFV
ncbi:MAG: hypothetical protein ACP5OS_07455, partial [Leptospirillia bacterium]